MKNFLYITFIISIIAGCKPGIPGNIIQPDKMALILHDIHIVDGYISNIPNTDSVKVMASSYYKGIYKKFGIDSALYTKSMDYYFRNPKYLDEIYVKVTASLTNQKRGIEKADSLRNARIANIARLKMKTDSLNKADSAFRSTILLRDTALLSSDTAKKKAGAKKKIDIIKPKMFFVTFMPRADTKPVVKPKAETKNLIKPKVRLEKLIKPNTNTK